ncbi:unnamed protein product, partial [Effrenium voratum]
PGLIHRFSFMRADGSCVAYAGSRGWGEGHQRRGVWSGGSVRAIALSSRGLGHLRGVCPEECPFVAPHSYLSCVFQCASASTCSQANANRAFPNNATQLCEPCSVVGCKRCASEDICAECFDHFWPEFGGRVCVYEWDDRAQHGVHAIFAFGLLTVLLLLAGAYIIDRCCGRCLPQEIEGEADELEDEEDALVRAQQESSLPTDHRVTSLSINQGKLHRLRCKVKNLEPHSEALKHSGSLLQHMELQQTSLERGSGRLLGRFKNVPFGVDLRKKFLAGVGLPLFHQWHYFLTLYSLLMCAGTAWIYVGSDLSGQLTRTGLDHASHLPFAENAMALCGLNAEQNHLGLGTQDFGWRAARGYLLLWVLGLILSLLHTMRQKRVCQSFHRRHPSLAEFALKLEGFPPSATNEDQILEFVRQCFGIRDLQISVCYDYRDRRQRVHELLEKILVEEDVTAGAYHPSLAGDKLSEEDRREVRRWCEPGPAALKNAGSVFVIFRYNYDLQSAQQQFPEHHRPSEKVPMLPHSLTPEFLPSAPLHWVGEDGRMHKLTVRDVACEPPEVAWEHLGLGLSAVYRRFALASLAVLVSFGIIAALVFAPLATYSINYVSQAGSLPTGVMMSVMGIVVMTVNWMIGLLHVFVASKVGFSRRDREGLLIFKAFSMLCFVSFLFNVALTIFPESSAHPIRFLLQPLGEGRAITSMQDLSFQVRASVSLFHVLVPGSLFIGYLLFPLQGFVWPFVSTMSCLRLWHRWSFVPELRAREAEKAFEPLGMSLGHDYMGFIVQPLSCSLTLFFASGVAWQTFGCLALWSIFMMPFTRYMHLRAMRRCYFSTNRIDMDVQFVWGFPHSQVLAASAFWLARIHNWSLLIVPVAWLSALAVYHVLLALVVQPLVFPKESCHACSRPSYDEVRTRRFYDWQNCNPIKVLLSHCLEGETPIPPFEVGKEYLQENCSEWKARAEKIRRTHGDMWSLPSDQPPGYAQEICPELFPLMVPEVEDLLQRPMDWIGQASRSFSVTQRGATAPEPAPADPAPADAATGSE